MISQLKANYRYDNIHNDYIYTNNGKTRTRIEFVKNLENAQEENGWKIVSSPYEDLLISQETKQQIFWKKTDSETISKPVSAREVNFLQAELLHQMKLWIDFELPKSGNLTDLTSHHQSNDPVVKKAFNRLIFDKNHSIYFIANEQVKTFTKPQQFVRSLMGIALIIASLGTMFLFSSSRHHLKNLFKKEIHKLIAVEYNFNLYNLEKVKQFQKLDSDKITFLTLLIEKKIQHLHKKREANDSAFLNPQDKKNNRDYFNQTINYLNDQLSILSQQQKELQKNKNLKFELNMELYEKLKNLILQ